MAKEEVPPGSLSRFLLNCLSEGIADQILSKSRAHGAMDPFALATWQFLDLLSLHHRYITIALEKAKGADVQDPELFASNLEFCLRSSRNTALSFLPAADRAVPEIRFQRGLEVASGILAGYQSKPINQIIDVQARRMFRGPWVEFIEKLNSVTQDIAYLSALHAPAEAISSGKRKKRPKPLLDEQVGNHINSLLAKGTALEKITRDRIADATGIAKGLVSNTGPWIAFAAQKRRDRIGTRPDGSLMDPAEAAIQKLTEGEVPQEANWEAILREQERDERKPSRNR